MIRVAIVEDDDEIRESLGYLIDTDTFFECKWHYSSCEEALQEIIKVKPDVVLMDIELPGISGIEGTAELTRDYPEIDIIMLTVREEPETIFKALCAGASGYLTKNTPPEKILESIIEVIRGGAPMNSQIARLVVNSFKKQHSPLSTRETEVLKCLCDGKSYKQTGIDLFISEDTVRGHIRNIYNKLGVHSKAEAVAKAIGENIV